MYHLTRQIVRDALAKPERHISVLGLDSAGKTSFFSHLRNRFGKGPIWPIQPTVGQNYLVFRYKGYKLSVYDLGGQKMLRQSWSHSYPDMSALIYVIDSADRDRIGESVATLEMILSSKDFKHTTPVCVCINKQDLEDAMDKTELLESYTALAELLSGREHAFFQTSVMWTEELVKGADNNATVGADVVEVLNWAVKQMKKVKG